MEIYNYAHIKDTRRKIVIVPEELRIIGIEADHNSSKLRFHIPRYTNEGYDLTQTNIKNINYINVAAGPEGEGIYEIDDCAISAIDDNYIDFSWEFSNHVTQAKGIVAFILCFENVTDGITTFEWHTEYNEELRVSRGLETRKTIAKLYPDVLQQWLEKMGKGLVDKLSIINITEQVVEFTNRLNPDELINHKNIDADTGELTEPTAANINKMVASGPISVKAGHTYCISYNGKLMSYDNSYFKVNRVALFNTDGAHLETVTNNTITATEDGYIVIGFYANNTSFATSDRGLLDYIIAGAQVEEGNAPTEFTAYAEPYTKKEIKVNPDAVLINETDNVADGIITPQKTTFLEKSNINQFDIKKVQTVYRASIVGEVITTDPLDNYYQFYIDSIYDSKNSVIVAKGIQSLSSGKIYLSFKYKYISGTISNTFIGNISLTYVDSDGNNQSIPMKNLANRAPSNDMQTYVGTCMLPEDVDSYGFMFQVASGGALVVELTDIMVSHTDTREYVPFGVYTNDDSNFVITLSDDVRKLLTPKYINKNALFLGDSITAAQGYVQELSASLQFNSYTNIAVAGATWKDKTSTVLDGNPTTNKGVNNTLSNQIEKLERGKNSSHPNYEYVADYDDKDIIFISAGANDAAGNISQTEIDNMESQFVVNGEVVPLENIDRTTVGGAMRYAYEKLREMYPNADIFFCTPTQAHESIRSYAKISLTRNAIKAFCDRISDVDCIDVFNCGICGIYETPGAGKYLKDGLHPNAKGGRKQATYISRHIKNFYV